MKTITNENETNFYRSNEFKNQLTTSISALHMQLKKGLTPNEYEKTTSLINCFKSAQIAINKLEKQA